MPSIGSCGNCYCKFEKSYFKNYNTDFLSILAHLKTWTVDFGKEPQIFLNATFITMDVFVVCFYVLRMIVKLSIFKQNSAEGKKCRTQCIPAIVGCAISAAFCLATIIYVLWCW